MSYLFNSLAFVVIGGVFINSSYAITEVYKCKEKGLIIYQSKPCQGMGQTVADKLQQERQAKEKRIAELREKEDRLQEQLKQQPNKDMTLIKKIKHFKNKISRSWGNFKDRFTVDS